MSDMLLEFVTARSIDELREPLNSALQREFPAAAAAPVGR
jgi:hypothetical protein